MMDWPAAIPDPAGALYPLIELSGRLAEIQLLPDLTPPNRMPSNTPSRASTPVIAGQPGSRPGSQSQSRSQTPLRQSIS